LKLKEKELVALLSGDKNEEYLKIQLSYLNPRIRDRILGINERDYVWARYGKSLSEFSESERSKIFKEYQEWRQEKDDINKYAKIAANIYDRLQQTFSKTFKDYSDQKFYKYSDQIFSSILSDSNFDFESLSSDTRLRNALIKVSES
jgi:hypothetical protein